MMKHTIFKSWHFLLQIKIKLHSLDGDKQTPPTGSAAVDATAQPVHTADALLHPVPPCLNPSGQRVTTAEAPLHADYQKTPTAGHAT